MVPPVVVIETAERIRGSLAALSQVLASGRPIHVVATEAAADEALATGAPYHFALGFLAVSHREAFVLQSTLARPLHLAAGLARMAAALRPSVAVVAEPAWDAPVPAHLQVGARVALVLEREEPGPSGGALWQRVRQAAPSARLVRATAGLGGPPIPVERIAAACRRLAGDATATGTLHLDTQTPPQSRFVRRQVLQQELGRLAPQSVAPPTEGPAEADGLTVWSAGAEPAAAWIAALAGAIDGGSNESVRSYMGLAERGLWCARIASGAGATGVVSGAGLARIAVLVGLPPSVATDPLAGVAEGGAVVVAAGLGAADVWSALPAGWRETAVTRKLRLLAVPPAEPATVAAVVAELMAGEVTPEGAEAVSAGPTGPVATMALPAAVRRHAADDAGYDSVARFWGEVVEPRLRGEPAAATPDPYLALRAIPPHTATFRDRTAARAVIPVLDAHKCTGCGACWTGCPDGAVGATAIRLAALLDTAADRAATQRKDRDPIADKLKRAHRQLAGRAETLLAKAGATTVEPAVLDEAYGWLADKMPLPADERPAADAAWAATRERLNNTPVCATPAFFHGPKAAGKDPELLSLAFDPHACQGCGGCAAVCSEGAIQMVPQTPEALAALAAGFEAWEQLPDTPGASIAAAAERTEIGLLPALLLSRHCASALPGGDAAEPGAGERLTLRLVLAVTEYQGQRRMLAPQTSSRSSRKSSRSPSASR